ncbi:MAG: hypothetical protein N2485_01680 [bacterium]|nr:hypothetical protein [bacterium]
MKDYLKVLTSFRDGLISEIELQNELDGNFLLENLDGIISIRENPILKDLCHVYAYHVFGILQKYLEFFFFII